MCLQTLQSMIQATIFIKNKVILWESEKNGFLDENGQRLPVGAQGWELDFGAHRFSVPESSYRVLISWLKSKTTAREAVAFVPAHACLHDQMVPTIIRLCRLGKKGYAGKERLLLLADVNPFMDRDFDLISIDYQLKSITVLGPGKRIRENTISPLTQDELICLFESSAGCNISEIAQKLCWSESKTKKMRKSIFLKLHVSNMSQAIQVNSIFSLINFSNL